MLDAVVEKGRGVVVDMLVQWGKLSPGDNVVVGTTFGKVRSISDDKGKVLKGAAILRVPGGILMLSSLEQPRCRRRQ